MTFYILLIILDDCNNGIIIDIKKRLEELNDNES